MPLPIPVEQAIPEHEAKLARLTAWLDAAGHAGVLLGSRHNFAWLSCGGRNGVDLGREGGAGWLFVRRDGRRFVLSSAIERDRLADEEVGALGYEPVAYPWQSERADPAIVLSTARALVEQGGSIVTDLPVTGLQTVEGHLARLRVPLTQGEVTLYRALGREAGEVVGDVCRALEPGEPEVAVAADAHAALLERRMSVPVLLVAADDRIARYRHPVPTSLAWGRTLMLVACAERHGLVVSLTRFVSVAPAEAERERRTGAAADVFFSLARATQPGATGRELYKVAQQAYANAGFPGEEDRHHQGGACGYRTRDWVAHPGSGDEVTCWQAFAWNPSIAGAKVEDTFVLTPDGPEIITGSPDWPNAEQRVGEVMLRAPGILYR